MKVKINGQEVVVSPGETILSVAEKNSINIPTLCHHPDLPVGASCRVCVVEVNGNLVTACSTVVEDEMDIITNSEVAERTRRMNLELLFSQHQEECHDCVWNKNCKMLGYAKQYGVEINRFKDRKQKYPIYHFGASLEYDSSKCIDCRNCIEVCHRQSINYLELQNNKHSVEVFPSNNENIDCIHCGQCIVHCPAGAFEAVGEFEDVEKPFANKEKTIIFQIAPAVRASIGEEFGLAPGTPSLQKLVTALKQIGADYVFDVSSGADITTIEESQEFVEKVKAGQLPLLTSCCPSWVRFVEFYYPEFIPHLSSSRSPHITLGGVIKKHLEKEGVANPDNAYVVSVMPCVSKKHEAQREQNRVDNFMPVDYVMTVREVGRLLKNHDINLATLEETPPDNPFGSPSGSAESYGVSGGVMQSAYHNITGEEVSFCNQEEGIKTATVNAFGKDLKLAVVHGLGNARKILEELKEDKNRYDFVEVMACPRGCVGGGGQPVPVNEKIRKERRDGLCSVSKKREIKRADENPETKSIYAKILTDHETVKKICHTTYKEEKKQEIKTSKQPCDNEN